MLNELLESLRATKVQTMKYFELSVDDLNKTYAPGKWTNREMLHHFADAETVLYERIRRGIAKPGQVIWGFDQDAWCVELGYMQMDLAVNAQIYSHVRDAIILLAERFYESHGGNEYVHSETGLRTVKDEFDKVAWHNEHHLKQIDAALSL